MVKQPVLSVFRNALVFGTLLFSSILAAAPVSVALVSNGKAENLALAVQAIVVDLPQKQSFQLVDRAKIREVIREQALSPLTDQSQALRVGKLLGAELFVSLESSLNAKEIIGIVIFDAANGARLIDRGINEPVPEKLAAQVSDDIQRAIVKRNAGETSRRISVVAVRNADLPYSQNPVCQMVGLLFERAIVAEPMVQLLERSRLNQVNHEQALGVDTAKEKLNAATLLVDLQISRGENANQLKAVALLSHSDGTQVGRVEATGESAATIAAKLATDVLNVPVGNVFAAESSEVEARRFLEESQKPGIGIMRSLAAAEAAYALSKTKISSAEILTGLYIDLAASLMNSYRADKTRRDALQQSQDYMNRALDLAYIADPPGKRPRAGALSRIYRKLDDFFINGRYSPSFENEMNSEEFKALRERYRHFILDLLAELREKCINDPDYFVVLNDVINYRFAESISVISHDPRDFLDIKLENLKYIYKNVSNNNTPEHSKALVTCSRSIPRFPTYEFPRRWGWNDYGEDGRKRIYDFAKWLMKGKHPAMRYAGAEMLWRYPTESGWGTGKLDEKSEGWLVLQAQIAAWRELNDRQSPFASGIFQSRSEIIQNMKRFKQGNILAFEVLRDSFNRKRMDMEEIRAAFSFLIFEQEDIPELKRIIADCDAAIADPKMEFAGQKKSDLVAFLDHTITTLETKTKQVLHQRKEPELKRDVLFVHANDATKIIASAVNGSKLWICQTTTQDNQATLELLSISLDENRAEIKKENSYQIKNENDSFRIDSSCLAAYDSGVYLAVSRLYGSPADSIIVMMPGNRGECRVIASGKDLPGVPVQSMALLNNHLYMGIGGVGFIAKMDVESGRTQLIISATRKERLTPFDDSRQENLKTMIADKKANRVITYLKHENGQRFSPLTGLWAIDDANGRLTQLKEIRDASPYWASPMQIDGTFCFGGNGNAYEYHAGKNALEVYLTHSNWTQKSLVPDAPEEKGMLHQLLTWPNIRYGNSVWASGHNGDGSGQMGKYTADGNVKLLPSYHDFRDSESYRQWYKLSDGNVLYVATHGVWKLQDSE